VVGATFDGFAIPADTSDIRTRLVMALDIAAGLVSFPALSEEWISVSKTSDSHPTEIFLDVSSITIKKNIRVAHTKYVPILSWPNNAQPLDGAELGIQLVSFNCKIALVEVGSMGLHFANGREGVIDVVPSWIPAEGPLTKRMLKLVCTFQNQRATSQIRAFHGSLMGLHRQSSDQVAV
jgi:hypothetical protein